MRVLGARVLGGNPAVLDGFSAAVLSIMRPVSFYSH